MNLKAEIALAHRLAAGIDAQIHGGLASAMANAFQLDQLVRNAQQRGGAWKQLALEIGAQAIGEHRDIQRVNDLGQLINLISA